MKSTTYKSLGLSFLFILVTVATAVRGHAQGDVKLQLNSLDKLEGRASQTVDVTLDGRLLRFAIPFLDSKKPDEAAIRDLISGLKGVYVKVFEFDKEGEYSLADVEAVRNQVQAPGWSKMVGVRSIKDGENVEVYSQQTGEQIMGMAVIATEPKQLTVVNIVGVIDLEKLSRLSGRFGIPSINVKVGNK